MTERPRRQIAVSMPVLDGREAEYVQECLQTTWISSQGRFIEQFETRFAEFCGVAHAVATNNGTTALHLALVALGVGPGDEVIVPSLTYVASANVVRYCGATPIFVDSEPTTMNLDIDAAAAAVTDRTKAIMPVHLYGHPADMDPLMALGRRHGLAILEDAAEAHGATYRGRTVGSIGTCAAFSFFGNKIITTGEGGMVTTDDAELAAWLRQFRGQGQDPKRRYWFPVVGYNYRMTNVAAAIGVGQLERVHEHLAQRARVFGWYQERLASVPGVTRPQGQPWAKPVNWLYTIRLMEADRDETMAGLAAEGVDTRPVFYPMHVLPPYQDATGKFPVAEEISRTGLSLPTHGALTEDDVDYVCDSLVRVQRMARAGHR
jgi:perosamine synthetase